MYDNCPEEKRKEINANDILAKIQQGKRVDHDCAVITGDLSH